MKNGALELFDTQNNMVLKSPLSKNMTFKTMISLTEVQCLKIDVDHKHNSLWYLRFSHMNFRSLNKLITQDIVTGIPILVMPDKFFEGYLVGKQSNKYFVSTMLMRSSQILEVVHSNVCSPFEDHTIGGNKYFVSFIDEYSQKLWIYVIKRKYEVFEIFKRFKMLVKKSSEKRSRFLKFWYQI